MKKLLFAPVLLLSLIFSSFTAYGATPIANAVTTDIVASINGAPIPCCNFFGQVAIFAEDLADYGFDVSYSHDGKELYITIVILSASLLRQLIRRLKTDLLADWHTKSIPTM